MDKEIRKVDDVRDDITKIDYEIAELFEKRMGFAAELALSLIHIFRKYPDRILLILMMQRRKSISLMLSSHH